MRIAVGAEQKAASLTPHEDAFYEAKNDFVRALVPELPARTASAWTAFDRSPEGKAHKEKNRIATEAFYRKVMQALGAGEA